MSSEGATAQLPSPTMVESAVDARVRLTRHRRPFSSGVFWPLVVLTVIGLVLRVLVSVAAWPTLFEWVDAVRFARIGYPLFGDVWMPAGYPVFLKFLHAVSTSLGFTVAVQHALGVATALLLYLIARRLGVGRWLSLVPAAVVLLSGDQIFLEHILMGDTFYLFAMVAAVYLFVRAFQAPTKWGLVIAGIAAGLACLTRTTALVLPVVMVIWLIALRPAKRSSVKDSIKERVLRGIAFGLPVIAVLGAYIAVADGIGPYSGLFDMGGFDLYSRVAPFANCSDFTPPKGTRALCESTPVDKRLGPDYYAWGTTTAPFYRNFRLSPATSQLAGRFARQAILAEPGSYAKAVAIDMARYVDPTLITRGGFGEGHDLVSFSDYNAALEKSLAATLSTRYTGSTIPSTKWLSDLTTGQRVLRVGRVVMLVLIASVVAGLIVGLWVRRGPQLGALLAISAMAFLLFLGPVATFTYDVRYAVPPQAFLGLAAALGAQCVYSALKGRRLRGSNSELSRESR
jgi:Dolichyl-phosphate-mannose-protein mannosyltransferase